MSKQFTLDKLVDNPNTIRIINGDAKNIPYPDNHFDSCVCDPPYLLNFMGKNWDNTGISYDIDMWKEVYRVLKPGAYLLAFSGSRTYHRMTCAIEDAGFVIHPMLGWITAQGFPKATNLSKQIDKHFGLEREVIGVKIRGDVEKAKTSGVTFAAADNNKNNKDIFGYGIEDITAPATDLAKQWDGWYYGRQSTKPALEPICMAQKPPEGKMVDNVIKYGTGAINIDGCRVGYEKDSDNPATNPLYRKQFGYKNKNAADNGSNSFTIKDGSGERNPNELGRFPANLIHDNSEEVVKEFPDSKGQQGDLINHDKDRISPNGIFGKMGRATNYIKREDNETSAARFFKSCEFELDDFTPFFYCPKASKLERGEYNNHPTIKPLSLCRYLVRLVTPPNGIVLDPFMGSSSIPIAAIQEGFNSVGMDLDIESCKIAKLRIEDKLGIKVEIEND
jgi:site-specific DNA-methyltransferase (adenine-specific)